MSTLAGIDPSDHQLDHPVPHFVSATTLPNLMSTRHENRRYTGPGHRSPCPALNTLANHGYISRDGRDLTFFEIVKAIVFVYNFSYPLAIFLTLAGFITCGHFSFSKPPKDNGSQDHALNLFPRISLHLSSLSERSGFKIAHDASFVHSNGVPSDSPDPVLVEELVKCASEAHEPDGRPSGGLGLLDIARYHAQRVKLSPAPLGSIHRQIALGECALTWEVLRGNHYGESDCGECGTTPNVEKGGYDVVPVSRLKQWFGDERLPDGWWDLGEDGVRPDKRIGLFKTRRLANLIGNLAGEHSH